MKEDESMNSIKISRRFKRYIRRTIKNKLCAVALILVGLFIVKLTGDGTALAFFIIIGIPLFFVNKNYIDQKE